MIFQQVAAQAGLSEEEREKQKKRAKTNSDMLFSKKPLLSISKLRKNYAAQGSHLVKNKLSEKMGRRDIQFYDLYKR